MTNQEELEYDSIQERCIKKAELSKTPIQGTFELLPYCNMSCKMCYIQQTPTRERLMALKKPEFWLDIIQQGIDKGLLYVLLTGGEITLYPWFKELYEALWHLPVYVTLNTNGTMWDESFVAWLAKMPPKHVNITLYGTDNDTYHSLCHLGDGFERVLQTFKLLEKYNIKYRIHVSIVPENHEQVAKFVEIGGDCHVPLSIVTYMFPSYRKDQSIGENTDRLSPEVAAQIRFEVLKNSFGTKTEYLGYLEETIHKMEHMEEFVFYGKQCMDCRAGITNFWVDWKGQMSSCGMMVQEEVDLLKTPFEVAWEQINDSVQCICMPLECSTCVRRAVCPMCAAAAFCETGKTDQVPREYCCKYAEEMERLVRGAYIQNEAGLL